MDKYERFHFGRAEAHFRQGNTSHAMRHLRMCNTNTTQFGANSRRIPKPSTESAGNMWEPPAPTEHMKKLDAAKTVADQDAIMAAETKREKEAFAARRNRFINPSKPI